MYDVCSGIAVRALLARRRCSLLRGAMHKRGRWHALLSRGVCLSVMFVYSVKTSNHILKVFSSSGSQTIIVFAHQTLWQYSDENSF